MAEQDTNKTMIDADNAAKADLTLGTDTHVDDGKGTMPSAKVDPFEARKALFKKSRDVRGDRIQADAAANPDVAASIEAMEEEAGQGSSRNELDRGSHIDTNRKERDHNAEPRVNASKEESAAELAAIPARVTVKVLGQTLEVPREDVVEAGGIDAYQKDRAASMRLQAAAVREAELKAEREQLEADRAAFNKQRESAPRQGAAKDPASTDGAASTRKDGAGNGADVEEQAQAIAADLYSGDPKRAKAAIAQVLRATQAPAHTLDPADVARQAAELLQKQDKAPAPAQQPVDAKLSVEIDELNAMMADKFKSVLDDPEKKRQALAKFNELRADPENRYRRMVDIGREAARFVEGKAPHPRQDVIERKRDLPPTVSGSKAHQPAAPAAPLTPGEHIAAMRRARGLPS